jgi:hypothetical protein
MAGPARVPVAGSAGEPGVFNVMSAEFREGSERDGA